MQGYTTCLVGLFNFGWSHRARPNLVMGGEAVRIHMAVLAGTERASFLVPFEECIQPGSLGLEGGWLQGGTMAMDTLDSGQHPCTAPGPACSTGTQGCPLPCNWPRLPAHTKPKLNEGGHEPSEPPVSQIHQLHILLLADLLKKVCQNGW